MTPAALLDCLLLSLKEPGSSPSCLPVTGWYSDLEGGGDRQQSSLQARYGGGADVDPRRDSLPGHAPLPTAVDECSPGFPKLCYWWATRAYSRDAEGGGHLGLLLEEHGELCQPVEGPQQTDTLLVSKTLCYNCMCWILWKCRRSTWGGSGG